MLSEMEAQDTSRYRLTDEQVEEVTRRRVNFAEGSERYSTDEEIAEAFDVLPLRGRQNQAEEADEGDDGRGALYDSFHGVSG